MCTKLNSKNNNFLHHFFLINFQVAQSDVLDVQYLKQIYMRLNNIPLKIKNGRKTHMINSRQNNSISTLNCSDNFKFKKLLKDSVWASLVS